MRNLIRLGAVLAAVAVCAPALACSDMQTTAQTDPQPKQQEQKSVAEAQPAPAKQTVKKAARAQTRVAKAQAQKVATN